MKRIHYVSYHKPLRRTHTSAAAEHGANPESHGSAPARAEHRGSATGAVCAMESGRKVVRIEEDDALGVREQLQELQTLIEDKFQTQQLLLQSIMQNQNNPSGRNSLGSLGSSNSLSGTSTAARPARYSVSFGSGENANATPSMQPSSIRPSVNSGSVAGRGSLNSLVGQATSKLREVATFQAEKRKTMRRLKKRKSSQESLQDMERRWVTPQRIESFRNIFTHCTTVLIVFNVVLIGIETDISSDMALKDVPPWLSAANTTCVVLFLLELLVRVWMEGCRGFWCGPDAHWNIFDFLIVFFSMVDLMAEVVLQALQWDAIGDAMKVQFVRSLRLARVLRGIRVMKLFRYVGALRTLALSIISTMGSLFWTLILLLLLFYSFGVLITETVIEHCRYLDGDGDSMPVCPKELGKWTSVTESMLTLFMSVTGGLNWQEALAPLHDVSSFAAAILILYVVITFFAILNVITGVFVNTAIESAVVDKEVATKKQVQAKNHQVKALRDIFKEIDQDDSNEVSVDELQEAISKGELSHFLEALGVSTDDVWTLFLLLDSEQKGVLELDEFVSGCMQLHGPAKSMQLAKMSFENKLTRRAIANLSQDIQELKDALLDPPTEIEDF
ncbi:unnamed protein product [Durusdinium trenchii]|uniref:EF-hand domain-containing protein n=2 Tax=Durusdinium trenchii TaxID=1381693 RepID=A0ABP0JJE2_9DINO